MNDEIIFIKYKTLIEYLQKLQSVVIAFSGGVDSTFLLMAAKEALGNNAVAVIAENAAFPASELKEAEKLCRELSAEYKIVNINVLDIEGYRDNPYDRCYICKKVIFDNIINEASKINIVNIAEGSNTDDISDYRPGMKAVQEKGILSPLLECDFSKQDIRRMSEIKHLSTWNKPSYACLASRFVYGEKITLERLGMVEQAEKYIRQCGFQQVRVRVHGESKSIARIEVPAQLIDKLCQDEIRSKVTEKLMELGFGYVTVDMTGYRTGSMNNVQ